MRFLTSVAYGALFLAPLAFSQPASSLSDGQIKSFFALFERIASPDVSTELAQHNESAVEHLFDLNPQEAKALRAAAQSYRSTMSQLRQTEKTLISGKAGLSIADTATLNQLIQSRNSTVASLATSLMFSLTPAASARLGKNIQESITLVSKQGAK